VDASACVTAREDADVRRENGMAGYRLCKARSCNAQTAPYTTLGSC
jgi:hypothetical protein